MVKRLVILALWLACVGGVVAWAAAQRIHIGRMVLPREQVVAIALSICALVTLVELWLYLGIRFVRRRLGAALGPSWIDHPAARYPLLALLALAPPLVLYARFVEPRWLIVRHVAVGEPPAAPRTRVRIAALSDLHLDEMRRPFSDIVDAVNAEHPDLVLLLGDTLNDDDSLPHLRTILSGLQAKHGKLAVRGNWEAWYWHRLKLLDGTGFTWLDRDQRTLEIRGQTIHLVGFAYRDREEGALAEQMLAALPDDGWRVFLYHTPDLIEQVPSADLYLAGHTHGGQVSLPWFGALVTLSRYGKRFERGLYRVGRTWLYVTPGVGVEPMVTFRLGVRPEVTLIELGERSP